MESLIPSNIIIPEPIINESNEFNESNEINDQILNLTDLSDFPDLPKHNNKVSLCLNMIVRNESKIIKRLLQSVLPIIDTYVICDTGSTDNTPSIIKEFFDSNGITGEIIYEPFKNFGYNRSLSLKAARNKATYALLLDADMIFKIEPSFNKESLTSESYQIIQKGSGLSYYNTRLIKLNIDAKCVGPTHEYYDLPSGSKCDKLDSIWIDDIGDGGSKGDKFERDIRLLKQGIEEEPNNGRYYFYLANSYFNTGRHDESIPYYKKRIELGGWVEEIFYAHLNLGHAYMTTKKDELAIFTWMNAYNLHSKRSETIYEICKYYRLKGMNKIAMTFCMLGKSIPYPENDTLFIHSDVYETGFDYELSVIGYYNNHPNINKVICKLMNNAKQSYSNHLSNYKFYCPKLSTDKYLIKKIGGIAIKDNITICGTTYQMNASNPCIFALGNRYKINIRFVNYLLNRNGSYHFAVDDGKIVTVNKIFNLDEEFNIIGEPLILKPETNNLRYVGIEDLKLFSILKNNKYYNTDCAFIGTCENPINNRISMGYGKINLDGDLTFTLNYKVVNTPYNKDCEKNWVFYNDSEGELNVIYQWYPLTIGKICDTSNTSNSTDDSNPILEIKHTKVMPPFFQNVRGSSNGCEVENENEIWFLCHVVEYCQPREYYHFFAVFDKKNMDIKRWSHLFKFEGEKIEYALGLIVEENRIIISYSKWDSEPTIAIYDREKVEKEFF
jgi:tetratricopeptide (TPR) repeat protein